MNIFKKVLVVSLLVLAVLALATGCGKSNKCEHDWVERNVAEALISSASCTESAQYYKSCAKCHVVSDTMTFIADPAFGHTKVQDAIDANLISVADCENVAVYKAYCSVCNVDLGTFEHGNALGHHYVEEQDDEYLLYEQSCEKALTYYLSCDRCGEKHDAEYFVVEDAPALGHIPVQEEHEDHIVNAQTCELAAKYWVSCERCNSNLGESFIVGEPLGHNFGEYESPQFVATPRDCVTAATYYFSCEHCGLRDLTRTFVATKSAGLPLGHKEGRNESPEFFVGTYTCGDIPEYYIVCTREGCGVHIKDNETGEDKTFEGAALEHKLTTVNKVDATETSHGAEEHQVCSVCEAMFDMENNAIEAPATIHNYKWYHTEDGTHYWTCSVEGCTEPHNDEGAHTFDETGCDTTCNGGCGYERESQHVDQHNDGICDKCGVNLPSEEVPDDGTLDNLTPWMPL